MKGVNRTIEDLHKIQRRLLAMATSGRLEDTPEMQAAMSDALRHLEALIPLMRALKRGEKGRGLVEARSATDS